MLQSFEFIHGFGEFGEGLYIGRLCWGLDSVGVLTLLTWLFSVELRIEKLPAIWLEMKVHLQPCSQIAWSFFYAPNRMTGWPCLKSYVLKSLFHEIQTVTAFRTPWNWTPTLTQSCRIEVQGRNRPKWVILTFCFQPYQYKMSIKLKRLAWWSSNLKFWGLCLSAFWIWFIWGLFGSHFQ